VAASAARQLNLEGNWHLQEAETSLS